MSDEFERYAVYWVPRRPDALARFGFYWTGWCADQGEHRAKRGVGGVSVDASAVTANCWRHGLHGVMKQPFRLRSGQSRFTLEHEMNRLADEIVAFRLPRLKLAVVGGRVALVARESVPELGAAVAHVQKVLAPLDAGRKTLGFGDTAPRPFVVGPAADPVVQLPASDAHRFHVPLTDSLDLGRAFEVMDLLRPVLDPLLEKRRWFYDLALMGDPGEGRPLRVLQRYDLRETALRPEARAIPCRGRMILVTSASARSWESDFVT